MRRDVLLWLVILLVTVGSPVTLQAQTTVVTFDNPVPPGSPDSYINGVFQGIDFGTSQWRWSPPWGADTTNSVYFGANSPTTRTFTFSPAPRLLSSMRVYTTSNGTLTLSDGLNATLTRSITTGSMQLINTGWTLGSTTVTVTFTAGWSLGIDDITHSAAGPPDTTPPTVSITAPASGTTVSGIVALTASATDNVGVFGVQFYLDGIALGAEDTVAPYSINWDTATASNGSHTLIAVARDSANNQASSAPISINVSNAPPTGAGFSLRFFGNGVNDIDRVKILIDDPATSTPGPPADVGATDFTVEFWLNAAAADNTSAAITCGANDNWKFGNIVVDRDRYNQDRSYGISIAGGRLAFGVAGQGTGRMTICGTTNVLDGLWHHVAVQRRRSDGWLWLYVDGVLQAQGDGPDGDISYPDNGVPGNFCGPTANQPCTNSDPYLVIGAEKHDAGPQYPSYRGLFDELRLSNTLRYAANFARPTQPFPADANTVALYHFDEGQGDFIGDSSGAVGGPSNGVRKFGGSPAGPVWTTSTPFTVPSAAQVGQWSGPFSWPLVAVHAAVMKTGEVLVFDGTTDANLAGPSVRLWSPATGTFTPVPNNFSNIFCGGHSILADGRLLVAGGNVALYYGLRDTNIFDPVAATWTRAADMNYVRWYPTTVTLGDGRVLVVSGSVDCADCTSDVPEIYDPATNRWTSLPGAQLHLPLYPFLFVLPDGRVLNAGSDEDAIATRVLDVQSQTWTMVDPVVVEGGSTVMYQPGRVMKSGVAADVDRASAPSVATTYLLDMNAAS